MKPNNAISECLLDVAKYVSDPEFDTHPDVPDEMIDYAAKLNRLVEAAREAKCHLAANRHNPFCAFNTGGECDCTLTAARNSLTDILRDIELPRGRKTSGANPNPS